MIGAISQNYFATLLPQSGLSTFIELRRQLTYPIVFYKTKEYAQDPLYWQAENRESFLRKLEITLNRDHFWYNKESVYLRNSLYPNFLKGRHIWGLLPPYHPQKIPTNYTVKRQRVLETLSSDDEDVSKRYMAVVAVSGGGKLQKPPAVISCPVTMTQDYDSGDTGVSDDDFQLTNNSSDGATNKRVSREQPKTTAVTSVHIDTSIWKDITEEGVPLIAENDTDNADICRPARCLPVFVGLLSLAAVPTCRILTTSDSDHARYWPW